jgi:hypothetical protein
MSVADVVLAQGTRCRAAVVAQCVLAGPGFAVLT